MILQFGETQELQRILAALIYQGDQMTALQNALATLQTDVTALTAAQAAYQANVQATQFSTADVQAVEAADAQVKAMTASLTPAPSAPPAS